MPQYSADRDFLLLEEGQHAVIQHVRRGDRGLGIVELGEADLRIGVDHGLLVDATHAFERADIEGVLGYAVAGAFDVEFAVGLLVLRGP